MLSLVLCERRSQMSHIPKHFESLVSQMSPLWKQTEWTQIKCLFWKKKQAYWHHLWCPLFFPLQVPRPHGPMLCFHLSLSHQLHLLQPVCLVSSQISLWRGSRSPLWANTVLLFVKQVLPGPDDHHAWERGQSPRPLLLLCLQVPWTAEPDGFHLLPPLYHQTLWNQHLQWLQGQWRFCNAERLSAHFSP